MLVKNTSGIGNSMKFNTLTILPLLLLANSVFGTQTPGWFNQDSKSTPYAAAGVAGLCFLGAGYYYKKLQAARTTQNHIAELDIAPSSSNLHLFTNNLSDIRRKQAFMYSCLGLGALASWFCYTIKK
jgi:hypothetical protein